MRVVDGGVVFEAASADGGRACTCFTGVRALSDGTLLVTFRQASARKSADGAMAIHASRDGGATWDRRYDTRVAARGGAALRTRGRAHRALGT